MAPAPDRFKRFVAIDWSGAKGRRHKGIAIAEAKGDAPPRLVRPGHVWSREEVLHWLLKRAANIAKGSAEPNKNKVGTVTAKQVEEIARLKMPDLNCDTIESAMAMVAGAARSMGVTVAD